MSLPPLLIPKKYTYEPYEDREDDVTKIFHRFRLADGTYVECDFTPYELMSEIDCMLWFDLDRPERIGTGPLTSEDLKKLQSERIQIITDIIQQGNFTSWL